MRKNHSKLIPHHGTSLVTLLAAVPYRAQANTHTWTAASNGHWNSAADWNGGVPTSGATPPVLLVLTADLARLTNTNNLFDLPNHGLTKTASYRVIQSNSAMNPLNLTVPPQLANSVSISCGGGDE